MKLLAPTLLAALALLVTFGSTAHATVVTTGCGGGDTCTMTQLTAGGTITAGSLRFHSFSVLADAGNVTVDEGTISLTGLDDAGLDPGPGFRFNSNGELSTSSAEEIIYAFSFSVTDVGGANTMKDGSLRAGNNTFGADDEWEVEARVPSTNFLADLEITDGTFVSSVLFDDTLDFAPTSAITARHNIGLFSDFALSTGATLESYTFRVSQIPEPSSLTLVLTGLVLGTSMRRHRRVGSGPTG